LEPDNAIDHQVNEMVDFLDGNNDNGHSQAIEKSHTKVNSSDPNDLILFDEDPKIENVSVNRSSRSNNNKILEVGSN